MIFLNESCVVNGILRKLWFEDSNAHEGNKLAPKKGGVQNTKSNAEGSRVPVPQMAQTCLFSHHTSNLPSATGEPTPLLQSLHFLRIYSGMLLYQQGYNKNHTPGSYAHHPAHIPAHTVGPAWSTQNARPIPRTFCKWFPHPRAAWLISGLFYFILLFSQGHAV